MCTSVLAISRRLRRIQVDLLLADLEMPEFSAARVLRELKEVKRNVCLVLLTTDVPAPINEFLEPGVVSLSFDRLTEGYTIDIIEKPKTNFPQSSPMEEPLARHVVLGLHDPETGRLDAKRIASYLHVPLSSLVPVTGGSIAAIHKAPAGKSLQQTLAPVARTISMLSEVLQSRERIQAWLNSPHPDLGGQTPVKLILEGHADTIADMLEAALAGQPS
jgi:CheY-like chemotaxis protein